MLLCDKYCESTGAMHIKLSIDRAHISFILVRKNSFLPFFKVTTYLAARTHCVPSIREGQPWSLVINLSEIRCLRDANRGAGGYGNGVKSPEPRMVRYRAID